MSQRAIEGRRSLRFRRCFADIPSRTPDNEVRTRTFYEIAGVVPQQGISSSYRPAPLPLYRGEEREGARIAAPRAQSFQEAEENAYGASV